MLHDDNGQIRRINWSTAFVVVFYFLVLVLF